MREFLIHPIPDSLVERHRLVASLPSPHPLRTQSDPQTIRTAAAPPPKIKCAAKHNGAVSAARFAAVVAGVALMTGFLMFATAWPRPILHDELSCAAGVSKRLEAAGLRVRAVAWWSHRPFVNAPCAMTFLTGRGYVQAVVFREPDRLLSFRVAEAVPDESGASVYRYRVSGGPDAPADSVWESRYPWFFTVEGSSLLVTHDARLRDAIAR